MSSLSYICIIWFSSVGFLRADSQIISARVGSTAVLPCEWRNVSIQTPNVQWNTASEIVFERKGVQWYEGEGYKNRVDVPQDKLLKGNCSLVLKNVTLTDAGIYESFLSVKRTKRASSTRWILVQSVELSVNDILMAGLGSCRKVAIGFNRKHGEHITHHTFAELNKFKKTGTVADQSRSGRPRTSTDEDTTDVVLEKHSPLCTETFGTHCR
ncbi:uncharacterized protein LOC128318950 isoform X1 [Pangasianodon hypophthalmus]|uniref:uncharacterized protein LOC128318950 isoform X1 n=1 Tax=Pangasianodon hypophthalmus TaxID=310915 RepID=UPI002307E515|nr:uncharacterized protein LOC128318950 isoform X1 [Pangasianodon hypophthalmus]XP_053093191.1 uncharacterized protein LOC128318950 isoform X1 [Pangasianodon hypophthalmus]XP_053093192.1 uncharacterized protein LOC128318950 isoform X1 [Pangasianodon hypophthalmus]XP_053093193.1 uncharacterized protein LOC128318950 isoform X1 [Pangasianodon hypophthalmus]